LNLANVRIKILGWRLQLVRAKYWHKTIALFQEIAAPIGPSATRFVVTPSYAG
jgi:hypothetical protein